MSAPSRLVSGQAGNQAAYRDLAESTTLWWSFDLTGLLGELQTRDFATAVITRSLQLGGVDPDPADVEAAVNARLERQAFLAMPTRRSQLLVGESALRYPLLDADGMIEQCELVRTLGRLPAVELGIVPMMRGPLVMFPQSAFVGCDDRLVLVEGAAGEDVVERPEDIARCRRVFDAFAQDARYGADAEVVLDQVVADYRAGAMRAP